MPAMSVGGLASGLDTNSIIQQLTALEQAKVTREVQKQDNAKSTLEKFKELESKLLSLQTKAKGLELPKDFNMFKSTSNYEDYATVSGGEGASAGQYELVVHQLATTQKVASNSFKAVNTAMSDPQNGINWAAVAGIDSNGDVNKTITISLSTSEASKKTSGKNFVDIVINSSDTLKDIANKINAAEGAGVKASIMSMSNGENRLVLTAVDTGTNGFYLKESDTGSASFLAAIGLTVDNTNMQKATSANALTVIGGGAATEYTTFDKLNTALNKNDLVAGDKIGIYLPKDDGSGSAGWKTFELFDGSGNPKTIKDVLTEINTALSTAGVDFEASLNKSGEIVLKGNLNADQNFGSVWLNEVKIQMGTFDAPDGEITKVKKDMGTLSMRNVFNEDNIITEGQNAFYTVDGMSVSSQSNDDDRTISGTTFNLKKADPDKVIKVSLESDTSGIADKIEEFVKEYNELLQFIDENAKASVKEVEETDEKTGKKTKVSRRVAGVFSGDFGISSLRENLRSMMSGIIKELSNPSTIDKKPNPDYNGFYTVYSSASRVGIVANKEGYYDIDKEKLTKALAADFEGVRKLFTSGGFSDTPGFNVGRFTKDSQPGVYVFDASSQKWYLNPERGKDGKYLFLDPQNKIEDVKGTWVGNSVFTTKNGLSIELPNTLVDAQVTFSRGIAGQLSSFVEKAKTGYYNEKDEYVKGYFERSKTIYQDRIDEMQKRIDQLQKRVDSYNDRLIRQFTSLEKAMSNLQAQSANMLSALGNVSAGKN